MPLKDVVTEGSFVRAAVCDVKEEKEKQFLHKQETIWNKGMKKYKRDARWDSWEVFTK